MAVLRLFGVLILNMQSEFIYRAPLFSNITFFVYFNDDDDDDEAEAVEDSPNKKSDENVEFPCLSSQPLLVNQSRLNDLVCDPNLSKVKLRC